MLALITLPHSTEKEALSFAEALRENQGLIDPDVGHFLFVYALHILDVFKTISPIFSSHKNSPKLPPLLFLKRFLEINPTLSRVLVAKAEPFL